MTLLSSKKEEKIIVSKGKTFIGSATALGYQSPSLAFDVKMDFFHFKLVLFYQPEAVVTIGINMFIINVKKSTF